MACFQGRSGTYVLVRNHELNPTSSSPGCLTSNSKQYDAFVGDAAGLGGGGTMTLVVDRNGQVLQDYFSLGGSIRNCAGGPTPWSSWISCEENTNVPTSASSNQVAKKHGYNFECSIDPSKTTGQPLVEMGRFAHEAVAIDPVTGYVYQTEDDRNRSALYRFKPTNTAKAYGALAQGGQLQAAKIVGVNAGKILALGGSNAVNAVGDVLQIEWVNLDEPDAAPTSGGSGPYVEALSKGCLTMSRGEGIWHHGNTIAIVDTSFGRSSTGADGRGLGAVWIYTPDTSNPERGTMTLLYAAAARVARSAATLFA